MPEYSNPDLPEVNVGEDRPWRDLAVLGGGLLVIVAIAMAVLTFFGGELAGLLPYEAERRLIEPYASRYPVRQHAVENYLQSVADGLTPGMALPKGMTIRVHYVNEPVVNAFATLGGQVAIFRGLLERMPDENTLAMVLAHEIGHALHRHPIRSLGRGVALAAAVSVVSASAGSHLADSVLNNSGMLTLLTFSRSQEEEADETAVTALARKYGHAGGATETFRILQHAAGEHGRTELPKLLSTHPLTPQRIERLVALIHTHGWQPDGTRLPIPPAVHAAVESDRKATPAKASSASSSR